MTSAFKVSIVIPCFNHGEFLPEAVASVTSLQRKDVEVVVVDDGSTDDRTHTEMNSLAAQGVRIIHQANKGLASARNAGIHASTGEYIFPLDADDHLRDGWIDRGIEVVEANPQVGVVYGDGEYFGKRTGRWRMGPFDPDKLLKWNFIAASALFRRAVWEQNGGYDGTMPVQGLEDWDFWLGAFERGWQFAYLPQIMFDYRVAETSMITRASRSSHETEQFISFKHALLYRHAWIQKENDNRSLIATTRNFGRLLKLRVLRSFQR